MFNPSMEATVQIATRPSSVLQRSRAVWLSEEKSRFMKKMTEYFDRAFEMMKRQTLAMAHYYLKVSYQTTPKKQNQIHTLPAFSRSLSDTRSIAFPKPYRPSPVNIDAHWPSATTFASISIWKMQFPGGELLPIHTVAATISQKSSPKVRR
jgi:hypothetical protein